MTSLALSATTPAVSQQIPVQESFQSTIQGEGYWTGSVVDFIRLAGCPVGCSWCDTGYGDGGKELPRTQRSFQDLLSELRSPRVVITGGEPFIHPNLPSLVATVGATGRQVSIETSGAYWQPVADWAWITVSPKEHLNARYPVHPHLWSRANEIKLIIASGKEVAYYQHHLDTHPNTPVFLQPEWYGNPQTLALTLDLLRQSPHYRLSVQLHKYLELP